MPLPELASKASRALLSPFRLLSSLVPGLAFTHEVRLATVNGTELFYMKTEVQVPIASELSVPSPPLDVGSSTAFPQFSRLPKAIRVKIWKYALSEPRIFWHDLDAPPCVTWQPTWVNHKPPGARLSCQEARELSEWCGLMAFGTRTSATMRIGHKDAATMGLWFNPSSDIIYWDHTDLFGLSAPVLEVARNLALDVERCLVHFGWGDLLQAVIEACPGCERILLVERDYDLPKGDITFIPMQDDEAMSIDSRRWGDVREFIYQAWRGEDNMRAMRAMFIEEENLPTIGLVKAITAHK
ncbi:hypothetical protein ACHAPT_002071 [Fusarium lateritium]